MEGDSKKKAPRGKAQAVLDDPDSTQLARDLARLELEQGEGRSGFSFEMPSSFAMSADNGIPREWQMLEAYECGEVIFEGIDHIEHVPFRLVEDVLLRGKVRAMRFKTNPDGSFDLFPAYPKLLDSVESGMGSLDKETKASAHAVMACLLKLAERSEESISHFSKAIKLRPGDWRLRFAMASSFLVLSKAAKALEAFTQAADMTVRGSFERFEVDLARGDVLYKLEHVEDAKQCFLDVLGAVDEHRDRLDQIDLAVLIDVEFTLCKVYATERDLSRCKEQWNSAEAKFKKLSPDIRERSQWKSRMSAQRAMGALDVSLLSHQECHNCRRLCENPMLCSKCKAAVYCSRDCQVAAWKSGHKHECKDAKLNRRIGKKEKKLGDEIKEALKQTPLDTNLDPHALWFKAKKLSTQPGKAEDSMLYFCVALFLDFDLCDERMDAAKKAAGSCSPEHPLTLALRMITDGVHNGNATDLVRTNAVKAIEYIRDLPSYPKDETVESIEDLDHIQFGVAMSILFRARLMGRRNVTESAMQTQKSDFILMTLHHVQTYLCPFHWLTLMFEHGSSNLDAGAVTEAQYWLDMFLDKLADLQKKNNGMLGRHWKKMRKRGKTKLQLALQRKTSQRGGNLPF